ncbi:MAG: hypothetical protein WKF61_00825 [Luteimonas sp.]
MATRIEEFPATSPFVLANANGTDFRRNDDDFNSFRLTASYRY